MSEELPMKPAPDRSSINWRSVSLGLLGTIFICGLTPYNDCALNNTYLVGNSLPLGVVTLAFLFVLLINGPLWKWFPQYALSGGEMTVALAMTLISCGLPSSGLMRFFPPSLVMPFYQAQSNQEYFALLERLNLPQWLFPTFEGDELKQWVRDPIVSGYYGRWTIEDRSIPYTAWIIPAIGWGLFLFALYGALLCLLTIVHRQWMQNERLAFPLAQIQLSLIEQPKPGSWLNEVLGNRLFWLAFGGAFLLHAWNGCGKYWPRYFIPIPVGYDLHTLFTEPPLVFVNPMLKSSTIYFTVVGVTYFMSRSVAFSVWAFFLLHQIYRIGLGLAYSDPTAHGQFDQHAGGLMAFAIIVFWMGRHHWKLVLQQSLRGHRLGEPRGRYLPHPFAFWGMIACAIFMTAWLIFAGASIGGAALLVFLLLTLYLIATRIIAETGLLHIQLIFSVLRPWTMIAHATGGHPASLKTFFLGSMLETVHFSHREDVSVYASHGMKVADSTIFSQSSADADDTPASRRTGRRIIALLMLALLIGYVTSFGSTLWTEYHHAWTQDSAATIPLNEFGVVTMPRAQMLDATLSYERGGQPLMHNPLTHFTFGFLFTGFLAIMRLNFTGWPLHPIGFLLLETFPGVHLWFSIFIGWIATSLVLGFGGSSAYLKAKPFFLGLIVGESLAAGFWLVTSIVLSAMDFPYLPVQILPG